MSGHRSDPHIFHVANEIANGFNLIGIAIQEFYADESIFDQDEQFQTIKPVGVQIVSEVRFIRDALDIDVEMFSNKRPDLPDSDAFIAACLLSEAQAIEVHDQPPIR
jgi:hypothetical protein